MKKLLAPLAIILILAGGIGIYAYERNNDTAPAPAQTSAPTPAPTSVSYQGKEGNNALVLLQKSHRVELKHYSFGDMVQSIDGTTNTAKKSWIFYANGAPASIGADAYITKSTDHIEWKFEDNKY